MSDVMTRAVLAVRKHSLASSHITRWPHHSPQTSHSCYCRRSLL